MALCNEAVTSFDLRSSISSGLTVNVLLLAARSFFIIVIFPFIIQIGDMYNKAESELKAIKERVDKLDAELKVL